MSQSNLLDSKSVMGQSQVDEGRAHQQKDCEKCIKIDQQYEEQVRASERLRQNNEDLKVKIDELSQILQEKLEALKQKKAPQQKQKTSDPVKKELDTLHKRIFMAQRQLKVIEEKQQNNQNVQRITEMKNEISEKQMILQKIIKENRLLEDIKIQNEVILAEREAAQEIKDLEEEAIGLRGLLKDVRKEDRNVEKQMTKQCQYLIALEQKHKEVCEKFGISPTLNQSRFDKLQDLIAENHKNRQKLQEKEEKEKKQKLGKSEVNAESYKLLNEEIKKKTKEKQDLEGSQKKEFSDIQTQIQKNTSEKENLLSKLRDKEKELNIAIMKINELKRTTKHNALLPLAIESSKGNKQDIGQLLRLKKDFRREQKGAAIGSETAYSWDNSSELPESKDYQIQQVNIWFQNEQIKGLQVEYKLKNGEKVVLDGFFPQSTDNLQEKVLKLRGPEYISSISGYYNNLFIEYLRIVSSRGNYILAGSEKNQARCKKFEFQIKKDEKPISFFGVVDKINLKKNKDSEVPQQEDMVLTSFGVELKKRENQIKSDQNKNYNQSQYTSNQFDDDEDNELYVDNTKKTAPKSGQNRKIINANNSRLNSDQIEIDNNIINDEVVSGEQRQISQENNPQNAIKQSNQIKNINSNNNTPKNQRKDSQQLNNTPSNQANNNNLPSNQVSNNTPLNQNKEPEQQQILASSAANKISLQQNSPQKQVKQENQNGQNQQNSQPQQQQQQNQPSAFQQNQNANSQQQQGEKGQNQQQQ